MGCGSEYRVESGVEQSWRGGMKYGVVHVQLEAGRGWGLFLPTHKFFLYVCLDTLDQILHRHVGIDLVERLE